jgi:DNA-binding transcriptional LysR family regulator
MDRDLLSHLPVVLTVARLKGFAAAAAELGMSPSAVSHAVRAVETRIGEPLFARTTRSVSLTEAGERILQAIEPAFRDIDSAFERLALDRGQITGLLRISASRVALEMVLTPVLAKLASQHPGLTVEVSSNEAFVDIVAERFDAGIRLGASLDQDMIAVRLTPPFKAIMVASPAYMAVHGEPQAISDIANHNCIGYRRLATGGSYDWELTADGSDIAVKTKGTPIISDVTYARDLALAGVGIAYLFEPLVRQDIRDSRLLWLLPETAIEEDGLFLYYPRRASEAPKLRAFIDIARQGLAAA